MYYYINLMYDLMYVLFPLSFVLLIYLMPVYLYSVCSCCSNSSSSNTYQVIQSQSIVIVIRN